MSANRITKDELPTSFGAFKPVGYVVACLPDDAAAKAAQAALLLAGFADEDLLRYSAAEEKSAMHALLKNASELAGFGHEVVLMRKYEELARQGCGFLLVYAPEDDATQRAAAVLRKHGTLLAEKYTLLVIEDLI